MFTICLIIKLNSERLLSFIYHNKNRINRYYYVYYQKLKRIKQSLEVLLKTKYVKKHLRIHKINDS